MPSYILAYIIGQTLSVLLYRFNFIGFTFIKDKAAPDGKIYWKCLEFQRKLYRKRVHTKNGEICGIVGVHNHALEPAQVKVRETIQKMETAAKTTVESTQGIIAKALSDPMEISVKTEIHQALPRIESISRTIRNWRQKAQGMDRIYLLSIHRRKLTMKTGGAQ